MSARGGRFWGEWAGRVVPPLLTLVLFLLAWDRAVVFFEIERYLVPRPGEVWSAAVREWRTLLSATGMTAAAAGLGFGLSLAAGTGIALVFSLSKWIRRGFHPYAIFLQTVPVVAVAPLINLYPGPGFTSVALLSWMISLFPIVTGATTGLTRVPPEWLDLFRLHRASSWAILWKLRVPNAVPHLVNGAKTSSGLAVIGAVVGDMFCSSSQSGYGLGHWIQASSRSLEADRAFAYFLASTLLALGIFAASGLAGNAILARMGDRAGDR